MPRTPLAALLSLLAVAGCSSSGGNFYYGGDGPPNNNGLPDFAVPNQPPPDLSTPNAPPPDFSIPNPPPPDLSVRSPDLTMVAGSGAGSSCTLNSQCTGTNPQCLSTLPSGLAAPSGYCTSEPCVTNTDCNDTNAFCGTVGNSKTNICIGECSAANQCQLRNPDNRCYYANGASGSCLPSGGSQCDPTQNACPCIRQGFDNVGTCFTACQFPGACPTGQGCYYVNGAFDHPGDTQQGTLCLQTNSQGQLGAACTYIEDCVPGLECDVYMTFGSKVCKKVCRNFMLDCPTGSICSDAFHYPNFQTTAGAIGLCNP